MSFNYGGGQPQPQYASVDPYGMMNQQYQQNNQQLNQQLQQQLQQQQYQQYQQYLDDYDEQEFDKTEEEIDEEMQRELAEDAPWKKIQQNTFTRWVNEHLKLVNKRVDDLQVDFSDGLNIIALIEVLSHKKLPRHNRKPMFRSQKLENVSVALDFLENVERIKLVNIDSTHMVDGKLKLILGLIWTLILHYSITMPQWEMDNRGDQDKNKKATPKQKLMDWVRNKMPEDVPISNFTTDWNDGRAIGALVDSCAPGLYPDYNKPHESMAKDAMNLAEEWLGVPQLIQPEEMMNPNVDELSMMTYLSQYPQAKIKPGAPLRPKTNPARVRVYGKGVEPLGNLVDAPTKFNIETVMAGEGPVEVTVINPQGQIEPVDVSKMSQVDYSNDQKQTYVVTYTPTMEGNYKVVVKFANQELAKSPYNVFVEGQVGDANKVNVFGPGIEPQGVTVDKPTFFEVDASSCDAKKCRAYGRGLQPKGVRVGDVADFKVVTKDAGEGELKAVVKGPDGYEVPCRVNRVNATTYECGYNPHVVGPHEVHVTYGGQHIPKSVFKVDIGPYKESNIRAYGPGLEGGVVGYPADFIVETNGETGSLGFSIEGPSQAKIDCIDNMDGSANVTYWPTAVGEYAVHILCDNDDIPGSPFMAWIEQKGNFDPTKVQAYGPGIDKENSLPIGKPVEFTVDATQAGEAPLKVVITDADYQKLDVIVKNNGNGTYTCRYTPIYPNRHTVWVIYGGVAIPKSPVRMWAVEPSNPSKVKVYGPGVEKGVKTNRPTHFTVDCNGAGNGDVSISITNPKNSDVPYEITQKGEEVLDVMYEPKVPGVHVVSITFNNQEIPQSPIKVLIEPDVDVGRIQVSGIESNPVVGEPTQFNIHTQGALSPGAVITPNDVKVTIQPLTASPSGGMKPCFEAFIEPSADGFIPKFSLAEPGPYQVKVEVMDMPVKDFRVDAYEPINPNKVKANGPGLSAGTVNKPADFVIDTRGAGNGALNLTVEGPCEARIECKDNQDGTCNVSYLPTMAGPYNINILYQGVHIPGSPFQAKVESDLDIGSIRCYGPGIDPAGNFIQSPTEFTVDASELTGSGSGKVVCELTAPSGKKHLCPVINNNDGTYTVQYVPNEVGQYALDVTYENIPVPGSTFRTKAVPGCDPTRVKAYGPGLESGVTNQPGLFTVETKGCGQGSLSLAIEGPSEAKMICKENQNGVCIMEYLPVKAGPYDITIKYADQHVPGSPFRVNVEDRVDSNAVGLRLPNKPFRVGVASEVILDAQHAGRAQPRIELVDSHGRIKPVQLRTAAEGQYIGTVVPNIEGPHQLCAFWDDQPISGSPFAINVLPKFEADKVRVDGNGVHNGVKASLPTNFYVDTREAGEAALEINIRDPEGNLVQPRVEDNSDGTFNVFYVPEDCGRYTINVLYGGQQVKNSPFNVKVDPTGDASRCYVAGAGLEPVIQIGEAYTISVDTREAGLGNVTCHIRAANGNDIDIDIEDNNDGTFNIFYTPHNPGNYTIKIKFGGQDVPNGDVVVMAGDEPYINQTTSRSQYNLQQTASYSQQTTTNYSYATETAHLEPFNLRIPISDLNNYSSQIKPVTARVKMPSGKVATPSVDQNPDGTVSIKYQPSEVGLHELDVFYNGQAIQGSPFKFHVDALNSVTGDTTTSGYVTAYGPGLSFGNINEACEFKIVTKDAGTGGLAVAVEGPSKAEIQCRDNKNGTCDVVYYPTIPGDYTITVKFSDRHIVGSPFTAKIKDTDNMYKRNQVMYGNQSDISLKVIEGDVNDLQAIIRSPSGHEEPCLLKKLSNGSLGISFTPREVGEHIVSVHRDGKHIKNSPFRIEVRQSEIGDASRVKLYGNGLAEGAANQTNEFYVNTKEAGYGGLSLSIEGPSKADIECHDNEDGSCRVTYKPTEPGMYNINVKFADKHVPGSPFAVNIGGTGRLTERIVRDRRTVDTTCIGSSCELSLKIPGTSAYDMAAYVTGPSGQVEDCEVVDIGDCNYCIKFVPNEMGVHTVSVKNKDMHIPGSPFEFTVGAISGGGTHKVRASGMGLVRGEVNYPADFNIYTREAGAGALAIAVEGPAKAEIDFHDHKDGTCGVSYVCPEPGEYQVSVKFNDEHIPESPFTVYISPHIGDARKLTIHSLQHKGHQVNKACTFSVNVNGAKGNLDAQVISPSGGLDNCILQEIDVDRYAIRFTPNENGMHLIHVRFNGHDIPESPFRVVVGQLSADPGRVFVSGNGVNHGQTGEACEFLIDTCNAGAGALAVTVDGPAKVQLDCKEVPEGYKVTYVPSAPGDYLVTIKFVGVNIAGSPFKCRVTGPNLSRYNATSCREHSNIVFETVEKTSQSSHLQSMQKTIHSDASRVKVKGNGLQKAFRNQKAQFVVDTREAGNNMLMVGVYGPKMPCEEVVVKHIGNQQYQVNYCVKDKGDHMLIVKYGDQHIPGSPFEVSVV